ncbi:MAG: ribbon-helix-helix protein, CopG family [Rubrivivax sp.]|nr:ribbon-helix-helix protein, CopG family [Rubrivivax sp.]
MTASRLRPVTLRLPEALLEQLRSLAQARGMSLSDLLGEAATVALFDARLAQLRATLEHRSTEEGPPPGYA